MRQVLFGVLLMFGSMASPVIGGPQDAVIRIPSHGGSGTVIATGEGWSFILSCAHMLEGADIKKPLAFDVPVGVKRNPQKAGITILAVRFSTDLSLLQLNAGPLPYVTPIAPRTFKPGRLLSVGYDNMKLPAQVKEATVLASNAENTWTREKPWHGRSGGGLIDAQAGYLVGVVHGYEVDTPTRKGRGVYVSHAAILKFVDDYNRGAIRYVAPRAASPNAFLEQAPLQVSPRAPPSLLRSPAGSLSGC